MLPLSCEFCFDRFADGNGEKVQILIACIANDLIPIGCDGRKILSIQVGSCGDQNMKIINLIRL